MKKLFSRTEWQKLALLTIVPEVLLVVIICLARLNGSLEFLELFLFDRFLQWRPAEAIDERITIIGIDEEDIQEIGDYPIPDRDLALLLSMLKEHEPRAIGLDIFRDLRVEPGHEELRTVFQEIPNLIAIEKAIEPTIQPPKTLLPEQIGFADTFFDTDGKIRRSLLGIQRHGTQEFIFSFSFRLAEKYLKQEGFELTNGQKDLSAFRFGKTEISRLKKNSGSYANIKTLEQSDVQTILNFRSVKAKDRFNSLSFQDIKTGNFDPNWIRDRIIIIGMTAASAKDYVDTVAIANLNPSGKIHGVEYHAHAVSQIISTVLDGRPMIKGWSETGDYLWILGWSAVMMSLSLSMKSSLQKIAGICFFTLIFLSSSYILLLWGWWIPILPILLTTTSVVVTSAVSDRFLQHLQYTIEQEQALSRERKNAIDHTFNQIHNGPLQSLHILVTNIRNDALNKEELIQELKGVDRQIRDLDQTLSRAALNANEIFLLGNGVQINLNHPLHELLAEVYRETITRDFPYFKTLQVTIPQFEAIEAIELELENKRRICQFLEEALCNVGKHAKDATRLTVICKKEGKFYKILVRDNGKPCKIRADGKGTRQIREISRKTGSHFKRIISPSGTDCELYWRVEKRNLGLASLGQILKTSKRRNQFTSYEKD